MVPARLRAQVIRRCGPGRRLFRDHDGGCVGVSSDQAGHHAGVYHAQPFQSVNAQFGVGDGQVVAPHAAGAHGVIDRVGAGADVGFDGFVRPVMGIEASAAPWCHAPEAIACSMMRVPAFSSSMSRGSDRKFGSMRGGLAGSVSVSPTVPREWGRRTQTWAVKPSAVWILRKWSSTMATQKCACKSGTWTEGWEEKNAPASARQR